ncbi:MAG: citramalate synthase [Spirochaetales bacterium]|nr:citramalate synthase [Spirochaetales bacterium]MCF7939236.1 citramalate synthase [Spirochaetales bacterium]
MTTQNTSDRIILYDTTLRDGMQGIEISYSLQDKLDIAKALDDFGIDYIEGGFPLANEKEAEFFRLAGKAGLSHSRLVAFGSTRRPGGTAKEDAHLQALLEAETPTVMIVAKTWLAHVNKVLGTDPEENLHMAADSISHIKERGREVFLDLEHFFDGYKDDPDYALRLLETATQAGADCLVLCDTNGGTLPAEVRDIYAALPQDRLAPLGGHFHNDIGTAVANSLQAVESGAMHVQGTINGWGERTGNADLCVIMPNLTLKMEEKTSAGDSMKKLASLSRFVAEKANLIPDKRQPYVGEAAFSHKAGQHVDVLNKSAHLMEHMPAETVGNTRRIMLSELAGKSTVIKKLQRYGEYDKQSKEVQELTTKLKEKEALGYQYEAAEASFELVIQKTLGLYTPIFTLNNYHLESFKTYQAPSKTVGRIFLKHDHKEVMGAACGIGPVETLDKALRDALKPFFPFINRIKLIDYKVRVINPIEAAASRVRVFITTTDQTRNWDTVGVSENIVEASWEALVDSIEYYYNNYVKDENSPAPFEVDALEGTHL